MLFVMLLGLVLGAAVVLLIEQWLRAELRTLPRPSRQLASGRQLGQPPRATPLSALPGPRRRSLF